MFLWEITGTYCFHFISLLAQNTNITKHRQGDALLARDMVEKYPDRVRGTFIHRIEEGKDEDVQMFRTYAEATRMAFEMDLLSSEFALSVLRDCETEMESLSLSAGSNEDQVKRLDSYSKILHEDIELARAAIVGS